MIKSKIISGILKKERLPVKKERLFVKKISSICQKKRDDERVRFFQQVEFSLFHLSLGPSFKIVVNWLLISQLISVLCFNLFVNYYALLS